MAIGRGAESTANSTAASQNSGYYDQSQNSYTQAQQNEGNFEKQLSSYTGANPYVTGGQDQTATNQQLSNTAGAGARAAGQTLQSQALRTGQNPNAAIAATEQMEEQGTRDLGASEAAATQQRIGAGAQYAKGALDAAAQPVSAETALAGQQGNLAGGALGEQVKAGATPSFADELGNAGVNLLVKGGGMALGKIPGAGGGGDDDDGGDDGGDG